MMSSPTTENTSEMPINTESVSHQILNKIDDIKQKITDNEYKQIVELLQTKHKECNMTMYEICIDDTGDRYILVQ